MGMVDREGRVDREVMWVWWIGRGVCMVDRKGVGMVDREVMWV